jgi:drug/metabolite transporter (DMT)-like permease
MNPISRAYLSYIFICIVWGTTFLGIKVAIEAFPPFLMAGSRQFLSGVIMIILALFSTSKINVSLKNLLFHSLIGLLLICLGNGLVTWAELHVSSGFAALICSTMPISAVLLNIVSGKEKFKPIVILGLLLGVGGVAIIFKDQISQGLHIEGNILFGIIGLFVATISWALGSMLNVKSNKTDNQIFNIGFQMLMGGLFMLIISPAVDDYSSIDWNNNNAWYAFIYLVVFGSILAYAAYMYALKILPIGFVTSYAYINPIVAVILGGIFLNEPLNIYTFIALIFIILGVISVKLGYRKNSLKANKKTKLSSQ